jgi:2-(1,2-epoxy-1,2-dihydrophenyl)acetyl-CoA isomerase
MPEHRPEIRDTGTPDLLASLEAGVLTLTFNRPEARNAMSLDMNMALQQQLAAAEFDPAVKCIVLTGAGKAFCAGGDVKGMAARGDGTVGSLTIDQAIHRQRANQRATAGKLFKMPKPTLAALPGAAAGAGLSLALACDLRIMASSAIMTTAFARVGFSGDYGGTYFLTQLVGSAKARELYFLSDRVSARISGPRPASCSRCPSPPWRHCPAQPRVRVFRWPWPATCASWPAAPS